MGTDLAPPFLPSAELVNVINVEELRLADTHPREFQNPANPTGPPVIGMGPDPKAEADGDGPRPCTGGSRKKWNKLVTTKRVLPVGRALMDPRPTDESKVEGQDNRIKAGTLQKKSNMLMNPTGPPGHVLNPDPEAKAEGSGFSSCAGGGRKSMGQAPKV